MKLRTILINTSPTLALSSLITAVAPAQIQPGGSQCGALWTINRTHNKSTDITARTLACNAGFQSAFAHWYDLSADPELAGDDQILTCVDFSLWSSSYVSNQDIFVRVYQDLTPGRAGQCTDQGYGDPNDPGPDVAGRLLLWEGSATYWPSQAGVNSMTTPRPDGDRSVAIGPDIDGDGTADGLWLSPDSQFFVEVGDMGEALVRFGTNFAGETGDDEGPSSANVTWIRYPDCLGGGCVTHAGIDGGDYAKYDEYSPGIDQAFVMRVTFKLTDNSYPPPLPTCSEDITGPSGQRDGRIDVEDLLALLFSWGTLPPPRPIGDVAPLYFGSNTVDVVDLIAMLAAWGDCPNWRADCFRNTNYFLTLNRNRIVEGTHSFIIEGLLDGPRRFATNDVDDLGGDPGLCGWYDYGADAIPGGFRYGDAFGVHAETGAKGGDTWFVYRATFTGTAVITTQSDCEPGDVVDTLLEVYPFQDLVRCVVVWTDNLACDDSSAPGCGDHALLALPVVAGRLYCIRIAGKFGETGSGLLTIQPL